jgi:hypothetical protein
VPNKKKPVVRGKGSASAKSPALLLARPGDPYITAWGERVLPDMYEGDELGPPDAKTFKAGTRRVLKELPAPPNVFNGVACVFVYTVLGLSDRDIAEALNVLEEDVEAVRAMEAYEQCFDLISNEFVNVNSESIHGRLAAYGHNMLTNIVQIANKGKNEGNRLKASMDIMDRGGHTRKSVEQRATIAMNDLKIVMIDGDRQVEVDMSIGGKT